MSGFTGRNGKRPKASGRSILVPAKQRPAVVEAARAGLPAQPHPGAVDGGQSLQDANSAGLPGRLLAGLEGLSGIEFDDVRVHRNSPRSAALAAAAYAQGNNIHLAPGMEHHLPHDAWHVVQQKQGRVAPPRQAKGDDAINDDAGLEREADAMGARALDAPATSPRNDRRDG